MKDWLKYTGIAAIIFSAIGGFVYGLDWIAHNVPEEYLFAGMVIVTFIAVVFGVADLCKTAEKFDKINDKP